MAYNTKKVFKKLVTRHIYA